jgi:hypothetical protein
VLIASGPVTAFTRNRLNITIKDVGDGVYDSVVFVEASSFQITPGSIVRRAEALAPIPDVSSMYTEATPQATPATRHQPDSTAGAAGFVAIGAGTLLAAVLLVLVAVGAWIVARTSLPVKQKKCAMCDAPKRFECEVPLAFKGFRIKLTQQLAETATKDFAGYCPDCGAGVSSDRLTEISKHFANHAGKFSPIQEVLMGEYGEC